MAAASNTPPTQATRRRNVLRTVCALIVCLAAVEYLVATVGPQLRTLPARTDFASYWLAGDLARSHTSPYRAADLAKRGRDLGFEHDQYPFLYPPPFALAMQPLAALPYARARAIWIILSSASLLGAIGLIARVVLGAHAAPTARDQEHAWIILAAFVPATLNSSSVHNDVRAGSVGAFLLLLFAALVWSVSHRRASIAGLTLAAASLVKLFPIALLPLVWSRAGRRASVTVIATLLGALALACFHWGPRILQSYFVDALVPLAREPNVWPHNQSLDAFLGRMFVGNDEVVAPFIAPAAARLLSLGCSLLVIATTTWSLVRSRCERTASSGVEPGQAYFGIELGCAVLALLVVMKITWVHTLTSMLFVWPLLMVFLLRAAETGVPWAKQCGVWACVGFFLSAAHFPVLWGAAFKSWPGSALASVHLVGLLCLWFCCVYVLHRCRVSSDDATRGRSAEPQRRAESAPPCYFPATPNQPRVR